MGFSGLREDAFPVFFAGIYESPVSAAGRESSELPAGESLAGNPDGGCRFELLT